MLVTKSGADSIAKNSALGNHRDIEVRDLNKRLMWQLQLDWPWIAEWAYADFSAVAVRIQNQDQFLISCQKN